MALSLDLELDDLPDVIVDCRKPKRHSILSFAGMAIGLKDVMDECRRSTRSGNKFAIGVPVGTPVSVQPLEQIETEPLSPGEAPDGCYPLSPDKLRLSDMCYEEKLRLSESVMDANVAKLLEEEPYIPPPRRYTLASSSMAAAEFKGAQKQQLIDSMDALTRDPIRQSSTNLSLGPISKRPSAEAAASPPSIVASPSPSESEPSDEPLAPPTVYLGLVGAYQSHTPEQGEYPTGGAYYAPSWEMQAEMQAYHLAQQQHAYQLAQQHAYQLALAQQQQHYHCQAAQAALYPLPSALYQAAYTPSAYAPTHHLDAGAGWAQPMTYASYPYQPSYDETTYAQQQHMHHQQSIVLQPQPMAMMAASTVSPHAPAGGAARSYLTLAQEKDGSQQLQRELVAMQQQCPKELHRALGELSPHMLDLAKHTYGNYLVSAMLDSVPPARSSIAAAFRGHAVALMCHPQGCRVVQRAFEKLPAADVRELVGEVQGHVAEVACDKEGKYSVLIAYRSSHASFITHEAAEALPKLATHRNGSLLLQRLLDPAHKKLPAPTGGGADSADAGELLCHGGDVSAVLDSIVALGREELLRLASDQYGNFVIKLALLDATRRALLIDALLPDIAKLSTYKWGSHVAKVVVSVASECQLAEASRLLTTESETQLRTHPFGSFVIIALDRAGQAA